jgi:predicted Zn-dependent protease
MQNADRYPLIDIYVAESKTTDARSFPGGTILITTGFIEFAESEAALVGILAHELSHIDRQHQLRGPRSQKLAEETFASRQAGLAELMARGQLLAKELSRPFRPEQEVEADQDAVHWTFEAGYDPMEMARLFRQLDKRDGGNRLPMPGFLRSHPYPAERFADAKELCERLRAERPKQSLYVGRANIRKLVSRRERRFE